MPLTYKQPMEALEPVLTNVLELKSGSPIWDILNHNGFECTEDFVNIIDKDIQNLCYEKSTKELKYLSIRHENLIRSFIGYFEYIIYDNEPIGDDWMNITNINFNDFCCTCKYQANFTNFILQMTLSS